MTALGSPQTSLFSVTEIPLPPKSESGSLASQAMLCRLCISQWDGYKYDREVSEEIADLHNAEKDAGRYRKRLLPRTVLKPITKAIGLARRQLNASRRSRGRDSGSTNSPYSALSRLSPAAIHYREVAQVGRDVPHVAERIRYPRVAIAVILIDRLIDRDCASLKRSFVRPISIGNVKVKRGWHRLVWSVRLAHAMIESPMRSFA